jgi:hypothetical protein
VVSAGLFVPSSASAQAETVRLTLDAGESGIVVADGAGEAIFGWAQGAYFTLVTKEPEGGVLPFEVPIGGLHLGDGTSQHRAALRIELLAPAQGTFRARADGRFDLELTAQIRASDPERQIARTYQIELTTQQPPPPVAGEATLVGKSLDPATSALDLVTTGRVRHADGRPAGVFHALLVGRLDRIPVALLALTPP